MPKLAARAAPGGRGGGGGGGRTAPRHDPRKVAPTTLMCLLSHGHVLGLLFYTVTSIGHSTDLLGETGDESASWTHLSPHSHETHVALARAGI